MTNEKERLLLDIGINQGNFEKEIVQEVDKGISRLKSMKAPAANIGEQIGNQFGHGISRGTERWMKAIGGVLRKFGGEFGRIAADGLEHVDRFGKAIETSARAGASVARGVGTSAVGTAAGSSIGRIGEYAIGSKLANGIGDKGVSRTTSAITSVAGKVSPTLAKWIEGFVSRKDAKQTFGNLDSGYRPVGFPKSTWDDIRGQGQLLKKQWTIGRDVMRVEYANNTIGSAFARSQAIKGLVGRGVGLVGGTAGVVGGGVAGGLALLGIGASGRDEQRTQEAAGYAAKSLVKDIEAIKDPTERARVIIKTFGEDGTAAFAKVKKEAEDFDKIISSTSNWRAFKESASITLDWIWGGLKKIGNGTLEMVGSVMNFFSGVSPELVQQISAGEANIARLQKKLDALNVARIEAAKLAAAKEKQQAEETARENKRLADSISSEKMKFYDSQLSIIDKIMTKEKILAELEGKKTLSLKEQAALWAIRNDLQGDYNDLKQQEATNAELKTSIGDKQNDIRDIQTQMSDVNRTTVDDLAGMTAYTRQGLANKITAMRINRAKEFALQAVREGRPDLAQNARNYADQLKQSLSGVLTSAELNPMAKMAEQQAKAANELNSLNQKLTEGTAKVMAQVATG